MDSLTFPVILQAILELVLIVAFFMAVGRLGEILESLEDIKDVILKKPENLYRFNCKFCKKEISTTRDKVGTRLDCPHCNSILQVP